MSVAQTTLYIFLSCVVVCCALIDLQVRRVPNSVTFPTMFVALVFYTSQRGMEGFLYSLSGLVLGLLIFMVPYLLGGMGAGDAKLMGAVGAILGLEGVFWTAVLTTVVGGVYSMVVLIKHREYSKDLYNRLCLMLKMFFVSGKVIFIPAARFERKPVLSYGLAISFGTLGYVLYLFWGQGLS